MKFLKYLNIFIFTLALFAALPFVIHGEAHAEWSVVDSPNAGNSAIEFRGVSAVSDVQQFLQNVVIL